jgi:hypothetical protein
MSDRKVAFDAIRGLIDLVKYVEERFEVVHERGGKMRIVCPWHGDTSPSLVIYEKTQSWFCFGCQSGGDAFDFISRNEGLTLGEIARRYISEEHILASWRIRLSGDREESHLEAVYLATCSMLRPYDLSDRESLCCLVDELYSQKRETELRGLFESLRTRLIQKEDKDAKESKSGN